MYLFSILVKLNYLRCHFMSSRVFEINQLFKCDIFVFIQHSCARLCSPRHTWMLMLNITVCMCKKQKHIHNIHNIRSILYITKIVYVVTYVLMYVVYMKSELHDHTYATTITQSMPHLIHNLSRQCTKYHAELYTTHTQCTTTYLQQHT